jgi:hypothetical protein
MEKIEKGEDLHDEKDVFDLYFNFIIYGDDLPFCILRSGGD